MPKSKLTENDDDSEATPQELHAVVYTSIFLIALGLTILVLLTIYLFT